jgi:hypothetical protein
VAERSGARASALELRGDGPVQSLLDAHYSSAHSRPNVLTIDLIDLSAAAHGVVIGHLPQFDVTQDGR